MADRTSIEWTDATWNPIRARRRDDGKVGWHCEHVSEGCRNCYSETILLAPLRWRRPRRIFVCSMTDLFASFVPDEMIDRIFAVMALCPQHTFQVLTKRPERMRAYLTTPHRPGSGQFITINDDGSQHETPGAHIRAHAAMCELFKSAPARALNEACAWQDKRYPEGDGLLRKWPLPNVWLGTSCEDQETADARVPELLATPAAVRFVSAEPLLGPIDLRTVPKMLGGGTLEVDALTGIETMTPVARDPCRGSKLDWIIVGGESGPAARPMHPAWARAIRDQCAAAGVAFLFKQWGEFVSVSEQAGAGRHYRFEDGATVRRIGKKLATRDLDGVEHNGFPEVRHG